MASQTDILNLIIERKTGILRTEIVKHFGCSSSGQITRQIASLKKKKLVSRVVFKHTVSYIPTEIALREGIC